jgi:hexokinase
MNVTWVTSFPTGHETGSYLTIDLGGTNMRVCLITLTDEHGGSEVKQEKYAVPENTKTGSADQLFGTISESLEKFINDHVKDDSVKTCEGRIPLGFTFSYPATQHKIDHGILQTWTKGWDVQDVEGEDVAELLKKAMDKRHLPVKLVALVNDTTGALIASAYNDPETIVGAIFGTGCNAAYIERRSRIHKLEEDDNATNGDKLEEIMAINCEYGAFDNAHKVLPRTRYDEMIDEESPRPGEQTFEKMSAGLYLGEMLRLILVDLHEKGIIFHDAKIGDKQHKILNTPYSLDTEFLSKLENDPTPDLSRAKAAFEGTVAGLAPSQDELTFFQAVAKLIAIRGARLCACGVSAICRRVNKRRGHVAADGSVAIKHPRFKERWECAVREILDMKMDVIPDDGVTLTSAEDGSGVGAAVICALALGRTSQKS